MTSYIKVIDIDSNENNFQAFNDFLS